VAFFATRTPSIPTGCPAIGVDVHWREVTRVNAVQSQLTGLQRLPAKLLQPGKLPLPAKLLQRLPAKLLQPGKPA
jgi:hypothetical protein